MKNSHIVFGLDAALTLGTLVFRLMLKYFAALTINKKVQKKCSKSTEKYRERRK